MASPYPRGNAFVETETPASTGAAMDVDADDERQRREQDEYLQGVRQRTHVYEQCVEAIGVITSSLEELSTKIEAMKASTQQLNAFTSGWLTVWKRAN